MTTREATVSRLDARAPGAPDAPGVLDAPGAPDALGAPGASSAHSAGPTPRTYHVRTLGCQMNVHDSEHMASLDRKSVV